VTPVFSFNILAVDWPKPNIPPMPPPPPAPGFPPDLMPPVRPLRRAMKYKMAKGKIHPTKLISDDLRVNFRLFLVHIKINKQIVPLRF
jgi:hypothetical protein